MHATAISVTGANCLTMEWLMMPKERKKPLGFLIPVPAMMSVGGGHSNSDGDSGVRSSQLFLFLMVAMEDNWICMEQ